MFIRPIYKPITLIFSLLSQNVVYAFEDNDIDGVEDSVDLCPNTEFDILVDKNG